MSNVSCLMIMFLLSSERQYLLTVIDHGGFEGLGGVSRDHVDKDVLLLHTACRDVSVSQLPRRRCGFNNDQTYSFPDILLVSLLNSSIVEPLLSYHNDSSLNGTAYLDFAACSLHSSNQPANLIGGGTRGAGGGHAPPPPRFQSICFRPPPDLHTRN